MGMPWVRLDTGFPHHEKVVQMVADHGDRGRAAGFVYCCALAYCQMHGTDGIVRRAALPFVHGRPRDAALLVEAGLWEPHPAGWTVRNFTGRQPTAEVAEQQLADKRGAARKGNCVRWHRPGCDCWKRDLEVV